MQKLVVMFGSFNPLTNAHIAVMNTAVRHLGADKGLFVATSGRYLRRKTVKLNDPFYLTEDERERIIRSACAECEALEFWGFELGGYNPARYKTLQRIAKQYPDAELYEVQGADKVRSISRCAAGEEYVSHIRFAVFERDGVDLDSLFAADALLGRYQHRFVVLPSPDVSAVSSTEVRRRYFAGEPYADLVPPAAAAVLSSHQPSEFAIPYELRMQTLMRSGRYGMHTACLSVYAENTALFRDWKDGTASIDLGDYTAYLDGTKLYTGPISCDTSQASYPTTQTGCINIDCADLAEHLIQNGYRPAILNLASARRPGGGYDHGFRAQEESLCHISTLLTRE